MEMLKKVNKYVLITLIVLAIITLKFAIYSISAKEGLAGFVFLWSMFHTIFLFLFVIFSVLLYKFWSYLFPVNIPLAIVLLGFLYFFLFITFMGGWVVLLGARGLLIASISAVCVMIGNYVYLLIDRYRGAKE
ncbi:hypothetical protein [Priestia taiwanensis]|uniref:Uncharacterized protein n=1 Tax=Priestia taiwanensis TaxID=1347902 RepID=A0A917AS85_9BACI|nr:hypothetical protein [Priestia taiwanensis]MBM7363979.1 hypothetical protein [Priestia taiwanensis]GGE70680.1 hypothetical protein GCM10007140_20690 [Priestia taiwanensis]